MFILPFSYMEGSMWYISGIDISGIYVLIHSKTLERKLLSNNELLEFLKDGNKILNIFGKGRCYMSGIEKVEAYSDQFYSYLSSMRDVSMLEDFSQNEVSFSFNMRKSVLALYITFFARRKKRELFRIEKSDFYIGYVDYKTVIYSQGYEYLLCSDDHIMEGVCIANGRYVLYFGEDYKIVDEEVLYPDIASDFVKCVGKSTLKSLKRRELLCYI